MCKREIRRTFRVEKKASDFLAQLDWDEGLWNEELLESQRQMPPQTQIFRYGLIEVHEGGWEGQLRFPCIQLDRVRIAVQQYFQLYEQMKQKDVSISVNGDHQAINEVEFDSKLQGVHVTDVVNSVGLSY